MNKAYQTIISTAKAGLVGILGATVIGFGLGGCSGNNQRIYDMAEKQVIEQIQQESPYASSHVIYQAAPHSEDAWYIKKTFAPFGEDRIVYEGKHGDLCIANKADENSSEILEARADVMKGRLWTIDDKIYWIDGDKNVNEITYDGGRVTGRQRLYDLGNWFKDVPEKISVGHVDEDGIEDIVYRGTFRIEGQQRNAVMVRYGKADGTIGLEKAIFYSGNNPNSTIDNVIFEDLNNDGLIDITIPSNDDSIFSVYWNSTDDSSVVNTDRIEKAIHERKKWRDDADAMYWIILTLALAVLTSIPSARRRD